VTVEPSSANSLRTDDASLVALSLAGNRNAFGSIVSRYQSLVCSVAFSATGSISRSEDLAQETFLAAWRDLPRLREPERLRPWLCGIARNVVHNSQRRERLEPATEAEPIESAGETPAQQPLPTDQAISQEEEAILWRSIERIPVSYREPMVLFYREHQSVATVADSLELSEELVRQRLSRGRKLLHAQVLAFVEGVLERSSPGEAFTLGVVAALPAFSASAAAAAVASTAAKGTLLAKTASFFALFTALIGLSTSLLSGYAGVRTSLNVMRTRRERAVLFRQVKLMVVAGVLFTAAVLGLVLPRNFWVARPVAVTVLGVLVSVVFSGWMMVMLFRYTRETRTVRAEEERRHPELFEQAEARPGRRPFEYRSRATLLGLPLVHLRYTPPPGDTGPALGWIAVGDRAVGVLFALGGIAAGGISVGSISVGVVAVGAVSVGVVSLGSVAFGLLALGSLAAGLLAFGAFSIGWTGALGGVAVAHHFALGGLAIGEHANDSLAQHFAEQHHLDVVFYLLLALVFVLAVGPTALLAWQTRRRATPSPRRE